MGESVATNGPVTVITPTVTDTTPGRPGVVNGAFTAGASTGKKVLGTFVWFITGFGVFGKRNPEEVVVYCLGLAYNLWLLALVSFIGAFSISQWPHSDVAFGWIYLAAFAYTVVLIFGQLNPWRLGFWALALAFVYLTVRYPLGWLGIVPGLSDWLASLSPAANTDWLILSGIILTIQFVGSLAEAFAQGRKTFTPNTIEEWHLGRGSEIQDRGGLRFKTSYPDILETILGFGSGDLQAYDRAGRLTKHYKNIPFLFFKWKKMDRILHQRFAVVDNVEGQSVTVDHHYDNLHSADDNQPLA